jgi:hypothetical protein
VESRQRARTRSEFGTREVERARFVSRVDIPRSRPLTIGIRGLFSPEQHCESRDLARSDLPIARAGEITEKTVGGTPKRSGRARTLRAEKERRSWWSDRVP